LFSFKTNALYALEKMMSPNNAHIQYIGRWDKSEKGVIRSYWGGAYFNLKFRGNALSLKLDKSVDIYVILDSGKPILFKKGKRVN
jgi:hypothetical protein